MARNITVVVEGQAETVRNIGIFDMELKRDFTGLVKTTSQTVSKTGKANAPVSKVPKSKGRNGDLKASIRPKYFDNGLSSTVVPRKPRGAHRHLVEYGTKPRRNKRGANRGKMPANPFMSSAESASESNYNNEARRIVDRDKTI
ncbi:hypothetical protein [Halalkalibacter alkalisediminis]|uniref:Phage protein n=1 Tax=Halalkalibacter alkalisediminis TaxID=935616 RepID=A0ABV6NFY4_9BACI|nr:hypothetical protein [Halalkalibacter alkalisediminis]